MLLPGGQWPTRAAGELRAGDPVQVAGSGTVERAAAGAIAYVGIASSDCAAGDLLTIMVGSPVIWSVAGNDIDPGELVLAGDDGTVITEAGLKPRLRVRPDTARTRTAVALDPELDYTTPPFLEVFPDTARIVTAVALDAGISTFPVTRPRPAPAVAAAAGVAPAAARREPLIVRPAPARASAVARDAVPSSPGTARPPAPARRAVMGQAEVTGAVHPIGIRPVPAHPVARALDPAIILDQFAIAYPDTPVKRAIAGQAVAAFTPNVTRPTARMPAAAGRPIVTATAAAPTVSGNAPTDGLMFAGGQVLAVSGTGFVDVQSVTIDGWRECTGTVVDNPTHLTTHTPAAGAAGQWYPLAVTTLTGTGTRPNAVRYAAPLARDTAPADEPATRAAARVLDGVALLGVALTSALEGQVVYWLARRPRYPSAPAPLLTEPALLSGPVTHPAITGEHAHLHAHGNYVHDHPHGHRGDARHVEGRGHELLAGKGAPRGGRVRTGYRRVDDDVPGGRVDRGRRPDGAGLPERGPAGQRRAARDRDRGERRADRRDRHRPHDRPRPRGSGGRPGRRR